MKRIFITIMISFLLFGCNQNNKLNQEITIKGTIDTKDIIEDGNYHQIQIMSLDEPIIIEGTEISKIEITSDKQITENEVTGILSEDTISDLSYSIKIKEQ